ncbi:MAG: sensor histidine kinase [Gemmatimonadaceae bacterium]
MTRRPLALHQKVGLVLAAILIMGIAAITGFAYREMRLAAIQGAEQRLRDVARQLTQLFGQSGVARLSAQRRVADHQAIATMIQQPGAANGAAAQAVLDQRAAQVASATAEVWDATGRRLLQAGAPRPPFEDSTVQRLRSYVSAERPAATTPLFFERDTVRYALLAAVLRGPRLLGYVILRQPVAATPGARDQLMRLVGSRAAIYVGNADGGLWTDFTARVEGPPVRLTGDTAVQTYRRPGTAGQFAAARLMANVPWMILVEFPRDEVLARTNAFLRHGSVMALVMFAIAGLLGWRASRRVTKPVEGALQESEARFRAVMEATPNGIVMVDGKGAIVLVNREVERLFGYSRDELVGQSVERLVPPGSRERHPDHRAGYMRRPETRQMGAGRDLFGVRKDGTEIPVEIGLNPMERDGEVFVVASLVDISARKESDLELRRSNEELQRFAYVASHDLQEPLRTVASYVQLLERRYSAKLDSDGKEFIGFAVDGARRMQRLVEDLLVLSRVGSRGLELVPMSADTALDAALNDLQLVIDESKAVITRAPLPRVRADARQLEQLFANLVANALKFKGEAPPRVEISAERQGGHSLIRVRDHGIGIDPQYFDRIFVIFQRLHARDEYPGTGIGLAICKKIVERHGGRIWVDSQPGSGATFAFTLPATQET